MRTPSGALAVKHVVNKNTWVKCAHPAEAQIKDEPLLLVCDYLQRRPAEVGSLCSSPPHPAGRPPHSLYYPATTVAEMGGRGGGGERGGRKEEENKPKKGGRAGRKKIQVEGEEGMLQSGLARGKNLNWWKPKPAQKVTDILAMLDHYAVWGSYSSVLS